MKKLIVGMLAALTVSALMAETLGWYRFEEFAQGAKPTDGTELVNSTPGGAPASLRVYDTSDAKYIPVVAKVGTNVQTTVNDLCPVADNRSLNFQQYGKKSGSAVVVPEWEPAPESGALTPSSFTVESFFKLAGLSTTDSNRTLFSKTGARADGQVFRIYMVKADDPQADKLFVYLNDSQNTIDGVASTIRDGAWHHLAFAYDAERHVVTVFFDYKAVLEKEVVLNAYDAARALYVGSAGVYNTAGTSTNWNCFPGYVDEVRISNKALSADELLRFRPLDWKGDAVLDISRTPAILPPPTVTTNVSARLPGLLCGSQSYADSTAAKTAWQGTEVFTTSTSLSPEMAYKAGTTQDWKANTLWTYSGYIWNRNETNETWTFASCILSRGKVLIDGEPVVENVGPAATSAAGGVKQGSVVVTPGAHAIQVRLQSADVTTSTSSGGGAYFNNSLAKEHGTEAGYSWASWSGIMLDRQGRGSHNVADYAKIVDAGDGALLTQTDAPDVVTRTPNFEVSTIVATNGAATVDLGGSAYELESVIGTPQFVNATAVTVARGWTLTALPSEPLSCDGALVFAPGSTLTLDGFKSPKRMGAAEGVTEFTIATAGTIDGLPTLTGAKPQWSIEKDGNALKLKYTPSGFVLLFR